MFLDRAFGVLGLSNKELLDSAKTFLMEERERQSDFLSLIAEIEHRQLHLKEGFSSLFEYCVSLGLSESSALKRIQVARAARRFPVIFKLVRENRVSLSAVARICPYLEKNTASFLLDSICGKSVREVEKLIADNFAVIKEEKEIAKPVSEDRVEFRFFGSVEFSDKVESLRNQLRHKYPKAKLEEIFGEAVSLLLEKVEPKSRREIQEAEPVTSPAAYEKKTGNLGAHPASLSSRYISRGIRHEVWKRDGGQCTYTSSSGRRCSSQAFLQWDHIKAWSLGGPSTTSNLRLLCHAHNQLEASNLFGQKFMKKFSRSIG